MRRHSIAPLTESAKTDSVVVELVHGEETLAPPVTTWQQPVPLASWSNEQRWTELVSDAALIELAPSNSLSTISLSQWVRVDASTATSQQEFAIENPVRNLLVDTNGGLIGSVESGIITRISRQTWALQGALVDDGQVPAGTRPDDPRSGFVQVTRSHDELVQTSYSLVAGDSANHIVVSNHGGYTIVDVGGADDTIEGANVVFGGAGNDFISLHYGFAMGEDGNDTLRGRWTNDWLDGGAGADDMAGGGGDDIYLVDNAGDRVTESSSTENGIDTVRASISYTLPSSVENLELTGSAAINATGNSANNKLVGNVAANTLNGGAGQDAMAGLAGDDTYVVDNAGDTIREAPGEGIDTVRASVGYALGANLENLILTGTSDINGTGNDLANVLTGNSGNNILTGGAGNDWLDGLGGTDTLRGGTGDDTYVVERTADVVTENAGEGIDTVRSSVTLTTLAAHVENLVLTGTSALNATGNDLANGLTGNSAANTLTGNAGADRLDGGAGADILAGGTGNDTYVLGRGYGAETVNENDTTAGNTDVMSFLAGVATDQLWLRKVSNNLEVSIIGTSDRATITNWYLGSPYRVEQFKTADGKTLLDSQVQNLVNAMAAFSPPAAGQTTLPANYQTALAPVIAANWQ
jgi:Ca2+-binding RTX toxin-like protein